MYRAQIAHEARVIAQGQVLIIQDIGAFLNRVVAWFGFRGGRAVTVRALHR